MEQAEQLVFVKKNCLDNDIIYVLLDKNGVKRIIDGGPYKTFRFKPGMVVSAVVKGHGCAGEEITELLHPDYKTGVSYLFTIMEVKTLNINSLITHFIIVIDKHGNQYRVKVDDISEYAVNKTVWCTLVEQKKGKLIFKVSTSI